MLLSAAINPEINSSNKEVTFISLGVMDS